MNSQPQLAHKRAPTCGHRMADHHPPSPMMNGRAFKTWVSLALGGALALALAGNAAAAASPSQQLSFAADKSGVLDGSRSAADAVQPQAAQGELFKNLLGSFAPSSGLRIELPYEPEASASNRGNGGSTTVEDLIKAHALTNRGEHVILTHREFPEVSVRIKHLHGGRSGFSAAEYDRSDPDAFCDPGVSSWSGYIDTIDGKSLFFYFFESRSNPSNNPVLLWTNGGPGCSSATGLFMELGPCRIKEGSSKHASGPPINGTEYNEYSWNSRANTIFIDQPAGVGLSYSRYGIHVGDTESAAADVYKFLRIFYSTFDRFRDNELVLTGESYGGRYLPIFASKIVDKNQAYTLAAEREEKKPKRDTIIPLKRVAIGNGITDVSRQVPSFYHFLCTRASGYKSYLSIEQCTRMKVYSEMCARELAEHCRESYNSDKCADLTNLCQEELFGPYAKTGRNPYDVRDPCKAGLSPNLCFAVSEDIRNYLNRDDVRELIGAAPVKEIGEFQGCSAEVGGDFAWHHDRSLDNTRNVAALLERDVDVLIYVGDADVRCNWLGNKAWTEQLEWSGRDKFHSREVRRWRVDGKDAGETREGGGLTWATIKEAGHMVPYNKPAESLAMLHRWLDGEPL